VTNSIIDYIDIGPRISHGYRDQWEIKALFHHGPRLGAKCHRVRNIRSLIITPTQDPVNTVPPLYQLSYLPLTPCICWNMCLVVKIVIWGRNILGRKDSKSNPFWLLLFLSSIPLLYHKISIKFYYNTWRTYKHRMRHNAIFKLYWLNLHISVLKTVAISR
jgi:hypothetical protein